MSIDIMVPGGESRRLLTGGKYCPDDIVVTAQGGGVELPELENPGTAQDLMAGKQLLDGAGQVVEGAFSIDAELAEQGGLIEQIKSALAGKVVGGAGDPELPPGYWRCDYILFSGEQIIDTDQICTQKTRIRVDFTRERSTQHYLYGVASSDNTASVTAYLGGSWRFGSKSATKTITARSDMVYSAIVSSSEATITGGATSLSSVNEFETVGSLLIGTCRSASGAVGDPQFEGKIMRFQMDDEGEPVLNLVPVTDGTAFRFWDSVCKKFHDSITDTPLAGGNW